MNNDQYIQILEKTNQQLSLWYNPYGIMIAALAVLFTVLTIFTVYAIYRQSKEYKQAMNKDREEYKKAINDFIEAYKKIVDTFIKEQTDRAIPYEKKINEILEEYKKELAASSNNQKKEIREAIRKLEIEKAKLSMGSPFNVGGFNMNPAQGLTASGLITDPTSVGGFMSSPTYLFNSQPIHKCSRCGNEFSTVGVISTFTLEGSQIRCPKCGQMDKI